MLKYLFTIWISLGFAMTSLLAQTAPAISDQTYTIDEHSAEGTLVANIVATDAESDPITYQILSGNTNGAFALDTATGALTVGSSAELDYETTTEFSLSVRVSGSDGNDQASVTIQLVNINDHAPVASDGELFVLEGIGAGIQVGAVSASDSDGSLDTLVFTILENTDPNGNGIDAFRLGAAGTLITLDSADFDYELDSVLYLEVMVSDSTFADTASITIQLSNINDNPATFRRDTVYIDENTISQEAFYRLDWTDPDGLLSLISFEIRGGNVDSAIRINSNGELFQNEFLQFDHEINPEFDLTIALIDSPSVFIDQILVKVNNLNDNLPVVPDQIIQVPENFPGTMIGRLDAYDLDEDTLQLTILDGNPDGLIEINDDGRVIVTDLLRLDFELYNEIILTIEGRDQLYADTGQLRIVLVNVNDNPPQVFDTTLIVAENQVSAIGSVRAFDLDDMGNEVLSILEPDMADTFNISFRGQITTNYPEILDFENGRSFAFSVVMDDGVWSDTCEVQIQVTDVNDAPTQINLSANTIPQTSPPGTVIGILSTVDQDANDTHSYFLLDDPDAPANDNERFSIDGNALKAEEKFLFEDQSSYQVVVVSQDAGGLEVQERFTILVDQVSGLAPAWTGGEVKLFPIPAQDDLYLSIRSETGEAYHWRMLSASGRLVASDFASGSVIEQRIRVEHLAKGTYLLVIEHDGAVKTWRFTKQ